MTMDAGDDFVIDEEEILRRQLIFGLDSHIDFLANVLELMMRVRNCNSDSTLLGRISILEMNVQDVRAKKP